MDNLLFTGPSIMDISKLKKEFMSLFDMIDLSLCWHYLGKEVIRD